MAGKSPKEAVLGRPATKSDCFVNDFALVELPDPDLLQRHVRMAARHPGFLPSRGFVGTAEQLAAAVAGLLIQSDPQAVWVLVAPEGRRRADRYFPVAVPTGERVWYRDGSLRTCG
jgi:hypothetical protein